MESLALMPRLGGEEPMGMLLRHYPYAIVPHIQVHEGIMGSCRVIAIRYTKVTAQDHAKSQPSDTQKLLHSVRDFSGGHRKG